MIEHICLLFPPSRLPPEPWAFYCSLGHRGMGYFYGFERLRKILEGKGYAFRSGSDCEILLPLYREYGTAMFAMLDAEFQQAVSGPEHPAVVRAAADGAAKAPLNVRWKRSGRGPGRTAWAF